MRPYKNFLSLAIKYLIILLTLPPSHRSHRLHHDALILP